MQIVTIARVSTMEDDAARVRVYPCTRLQHLINARTCMEVQHVFGMSHLYTNVFTPYYVVLMAQETSV